MSAPPQTQQAPAGHNNGPIDHNDMQDWMERFNGVLSKSGEHLNEKSPEDSREWHNSFFGCLDPIDLCLITYCVPCVTFGKTHHRTRKDATMAGYEPINTSCLIFLGSAMFGLHWIPQSIQRSEIRKKYHLQGSCLTDIATACCCAICDLVQQEKETEFREKETAGQGAAVQYAGGDNMAYAPQKN